MVRGGRRRRRLNSASPCDQAVVLRNREPPLKQDSCLCLLLSKKRVAARKLQEPCAAKWATACPARREHPRHIQGVWWPTERDASGKHLWKLFLCPRVWAYFTRAYGDRVWSFYGIFALLTENIYIPASFFINSYLRTADIWLLVNVFTRALSVARWPFALVLSPA